MKRAFKLNLRFSDLNQIKLNLSIFSENCNFSTSENFLRAALKAWKMLVILYICTYKEWYIICTIKLSETNIPFFVSLPHVKLMLVNRKCFFVKTGTIISCRKKKIFSFFPGKRYRTVQTPKFTMVCGYEINMGSS